MNKMKIFKHSNGFIVSFGFDMMKRCEAPRLICWDDPGTGDWEVKPSNLAGSVSLPFTINPEFVRECDGKIVAYQAGICIEMTFIGSPYVWSIKALQSDTLDTIAA